MQIEQIYVVYTAITPDWMPARHKDVYYERSDGSVVYMSGAPAQDGDLSTRIEVFQPDSPGLAQVGSWDLGREVITSDRVQMFHDHVLVKEPGTTRPTPWHQDGPHYFVEGQQTVSFWSPVDPVKEASLRCVAGSHLWPREVLPTRWLAETAFYPDPDRYMPVPDPDAEGMSVLEWQMEPGDAVAFHFRTLHGARGNPAAARRRAFSLRLVGDDARYVERPGRTSPPFPGHGMVAGQTLREDWFPYLL